METPALWLLPFVALLFSIAVLPLAAAPAMGQGRLSGARCGPRRAPGRRRTPGSPRPRRTGVRFVRPPPRLAVRGHVGNPRLGRHPGPSVHERRPAPRSAESSPRSSARPARRCCSSGSCSRSTPRGRTCLTRSSSSSSSSRTSGGCLTPLGDPPLFLGYLAGVPFFWTLRLAGEWALALAALLGTYFLVERKTLRGGAAARPFGPTRRRSGRSASRGSGTCLSSVASWPPRPFWRLPTVKPRIFRARVSASRSRRGDSGPRPGSRGIRSWKWRFSSPASSSRWSRRSPCSVSALRRSGSRGPGTSSGRRAHSRPGSTTLRRTPRSSHWRAGSADPRWPGSPRGSSRRSRLAPCSSAR